MSSDSRGDRFTEFIVAVHVVASPPPGCESSRFCEEEAWYQIGGEEKKNIFVSIQPSLQEEREQRRQHPRPPSLCSRTPGPPLPGEALSTKTKCIIIIIFVSKISVAVVSGSGVLPVGQPGASSGRRRFLAGLVRMEIPAVVPGSHIVQGNIPTL
ncbi:hypothetical protein KUCAC02_011041 [Chaenocephalus aceratus]|uniref:Uncharacterized protein n=1 Tax=Chaenocephalus aceratus TaxID=36190 RepID=A0ACB9WW60_CHAAC|nr:hypothetical protein KUCAC02_011041 [Chaenocephalus aceratus]